ncbi:MAG: hypothetical protein C7B44_14035, partial [Sulfobacillus thermosulfidooxidans]
RQSREDASPQIIISASDLKADLLYHARQQQKEHVPRITGSDAEVLGALRQVYELIVPSSVGKSGDSKTIARKFLSPLTDPDSAGGRDQSASGRKPTWTKMKAEGNPLWEEKFRQWKDRKDNDPTPFVLNQLADYGLLPLIRLFTDVGENIFDPKKPGQFVRPWDRSMFQQAIERLMSWESWNQRVRQEWEALTQKHSAFYREQFTAEPDAALYRVAQSLEEEMRKEHQGFATDAPEAFRIRRVALKGFDRLLERWQKTLGKNGQSATLLDDIRRVQSDLGDKFGSAPLYQKLVDERWQRLWTVDPTFLQRYAAFNDLTQRLQRAKRVANLTLPDAVAHPIWSRYEGPNASSGNRYHIHLPTTGQPSSVTFDRILWPDGDGGWYERKRVTVFLRPSHQVDRIREAPTDSVVDNFPLVVEDQSARTILRASWGGAKLEYDRNRLPRQLKKGVPDSIYLSLTLNLDTTKPSGLFHMQQNGRVWIRKDVVMQYYNEIPGDNVQFKPLYVMSVDLGIRSAAAVSIFSVQLKTGIEEHRLTYPVADCPGLVAVHERSVLLTMPGERREQRDRRYEQQRQGLRELRTDMRGMNDLLRGAYVDGDRREEFLARLSKLEETSPELWEPVYRSLNDSKMAPAAEWERLVVYCHRQVEQSLSSRIQNLRSGRSAYRMSGGLSLDHVQDLERIRGIIASWTNHPRIPGSVVRWQQGRSHTVALGRHILELKRDRVKKVANYLIMTALGYAYDSKRARGEKWVRRYPSCHLMVFEDLTRYRFRTDRPRSENRQLMRWTHQELIAVTGIQAEPHGILVGTMYAGFSSRFDAVTKAPGVRGATVRQILRTRGMVRLKEIAADVGVDINTLRPHDVLPTGDGEYLLSVVRHRDSYRLKQVHADINAAHNLQRRLWTQDEVFRVSCRLALNSERVVATPPPSYNKRYGKGFFEKGDNGVYIWKTGGKIKISDMLEEDMDIPEDTAELLRGNSVTLFRDPSGTIAGGNWLEAKEFWGRVNSLVNKGVRDKILGGIPVDNSSAHAE